MKKKDPGIIKIRKEIRKLRRKLYKARHEYKYAITMKYKKYLKLYMDDLKEDIGWLLLNCREYETGLVIYQSLSWKTHGKVKYSGLCRALIGMGNYEEAFKLLERGLKRFPESGPLLLMAGFVNMRLGRSYEALKYCEYAYTLDPENIHALDGKAMVLYDLRFYEEAAEIYRYLNEQDSDEPWYLYKMGYCSLYQGYPEEAAAYFKTVYEIAFLSPDMHEELYPGIYRGLYYSYIDSGLLQEALEIAEAGLRACPDDPGMYENLAECYLDKGWTDEARDLLHEGIKKFPDDEGLRELLDEIEGEDDDPDNIDPLPFLIALIIEQVRRYRNG
jgi:tetratricopeptide (TPR) repeat protein